MSVVPIIQVRVCKVPKCLLMWQLLDRLMQLKKGGKPSVLGTTEKGLQFGINGNEFVLT